MKKSWAPWKKQRLLPIYPHKS